MWFVTFTRYHTYDAATTASGHVWVRTKEGAIRRCQREVYASFANDHNDRYFDEKKVSFTEWLSQIQTFGRLYEQYRAQNPLPKHPVHLCTRACEVTDTCPASTYTDSLQRAWKTQQEVVTSQVYEEQRVNKLDQASKLCGLLSSAPYFRYADVVKMWNTLESVRAKSVQSLDGVFKYY